MANETLIEVVGGTYNLFERLVLATETIASKLAVQAPSATPNTPSLPCPAEKCGAFNSSDCSRCCRAFHDQFEAQQA
jgi:hypothetical protein